jgi:bifunctional DNase/RNase
MVAERVEVRVLALRFERLGGHVVDLVEMTFPSSQPGRGRKLSISIGAVEAEAITLGVERRELPRPMTHDLLLHTVSDLGFELESVTINKIEDRVFHAELRLVPRTIATGVGGESNDALREVLVESRTSDALALAVRTSCPIFVAEAVMAEAGYEDEVSEEGADSVLAEFKEFIDTISPEDFTE